MTFTLEGQDATYTYCPVTKSFADARTACQDLGAGDLVEFATKEEFDAFASRTSTRSTVWIGYTDAEEEGTFKWVSGNAYYTPGVSEFWRTGEPNNTDDNEHCASLEYGWANDSDCEEALDFACRTTTAARE